MAGMRETIEHGNMSRKHEVTAQGVRGLCQIALRTIGQVALWGRQQKACGEGMRKSV